MTFDWQLAATFAAIALAAGEVLRRAAATLRQRRAGACGGGCAACPGGQSKGPELVSIEIAKSRSR